MRPASILTLSYPSIVAATCFANASLLPRRCAVGVSESVTYAYPATEASSITFSITFCRP